MLMLMLMLACADDKAPEPDTGAPVAEVFQPQGGEWTMSVAETWEGDCALDDPQTHQAPEQTWVVDPRGDHVNILPNFWELLHCDLEDAALSCDVGSWSSEQGSSTASITHLLVGTFEDATHFSGAFTIDAACDGRGCKTLTGLYGENMEMPCSVAASVEGEAREGT